MGEARAALLRGIAEAVGSGVNLIEAKTEHSRMGHPPPPPPPSHENWHKDEQRALWWLWHEKGVEKADPVKDQLV
jgi:hypothetical protein